MIATRPLRVLLAHPGIDETGARREFPPWGVIFVGQALARSGHVVQVVDWNGEPALETALDRQVIDFRPDILGVTGKWGRAARRAERLFRHAAAHHPAIRRALGGPLAATLPANATIAPLVHAVLPGDGETTLLRWMAAGMPNLRDASPAQDADLGACCLDPAPLFDLAPYVRPAERSDLDVPTLFVSGSRGCVARCSFCYTLAHAPSGLREMPAPLLAHGLRGLYQRYGVTGFYFVDDGLVSRARWRRDFCQELRALDVPLRWGVDLRTAEATSATLGELWQGGCRALYMGFETADDAAHRGMLRKGPTAGGVGGALQRAMAIGFRVRASVVIGWPGESRTAIERTLAAVQAQPGLLVDAFRYNPLPNTPLAAASAPQFGPQHVYTEYGADAPNLSDCSDAYIQSAWERLLALANARNAVAATTLT